MPSESPTSSRDPEVQSLLVESLKLIAKAEGLYEQLTEHQMEMAGFLRRAQDFVNTEGSKDEHEPA
jgi:hypothetical protein